MEFEAFLTLDAPLFPVLNKSIFSINVPRYFQLNKCVFASAQNRTEVLRNSMFW